MLQVLCIFVIIYFVLMKAIFRENLCIAEFVCDKVLNI
jgi:hypothetical protein